MLSSVYARLVITAIAIRQTVATPRILMLLKHCKQEAYLYDTREKQSFITRLLSFMALLVNATL